MKTRRETLGLLPFLILGSVRAATEESPPGEHDLNNPRALIGPLVMTGTIAGAVTCAWSPDMPVQSRSINSRVPLEGDTTPKRLRLTNGYINARFSSDAAQGKAFQAQFEEGIHLLLGGKPFWFTTAGVDCGTDYYPIHGILCLDEKGTDRLDAKLVRAGYAEVSSEVPGSMTKIDHNGYRDDLLRLEGMARAEKLGVWKAP